MLIVKCACTLLHTKFDIYIYNDSNPNGRCFVATRLKMFLACKLQVPTVIKLPVSANSLRAKYDMISMICFECIDVCYIYTDANPRMTMDMYPSTPIYRHIYIMFVLTLWTI
jgi:hypothetical protein